MDWRAGLATGGRPDFPRLLNLAGPCLLALPGPSPLMPPPDVSPPPDTAIVKHSGPCRLDITVEGQTFVCRDGDVLGRRGTLGVERLGRVSVISRRHLQVHRAPTGQWRLSVLAEARNATLLDGVVLARGEDHPIHPGEHRVEIEGFIFTLNAEPEAEAAELAVAGDHPDHHGDGSRRSPGDHDPGATGARTHDPAADLGRIHREFGGSDGLLRLIGDHVADLIAIVDSAGRRVWNNAAYFTTLGYPADDPNRVDGIMNIHGDDREAVRSVFVESMRTGIGQRIEYRMQHRHGRWVWLESEARVVEGASSGGRFLVLVARDVTARKEAEAERAEVFRALAESQRQLAAELVEAGNYVRGLLPPPQRDGEIETDWRYVPSEALGGDAFGHHALDDDHLALYLLDAVGHGVRAALLAVSAINILRSGSLEADFHDPEGVLRALNRAFQMERQNNMFFTLWYGVFRRSTRRLTFAAAGHPPAMLLEGLDGFPPVPPVPLGTPGLMIGADDESEFTHAHHVLPPASRLYLFSDGAFEVSRPDGMPWGFESFTSRLGAPGHEGVTELDSLRRAAQEAQGGKELLPDDFSILKFVFH